MKTEVGKAPIPTIWQEIAKKAVEFVEMRKKADLDELFASFFLQICSSVSICVHPRLKYAFFLNSDIGHWTLAFGLSPFSFKKSAKKVLTRARISAKVPLHTAT
ncbi:MAG TPA: hypothetical protein VIW67_19130 [Terriglobales bacterium]